MELKTTERELERLTERYQKLEESRKSFFEEWRAGIRQANDDGLSYDRIATITGLSKTQVQRICGA